MKNNKVYVYVHKRNSAKDVVKFLDMNNVPYEVICVTKGNLTQQEIITMIELAGGLEDVISTRSKIYSELESLMESDSFTMFQLYEFISEHPNVLKYPIVHNYKTLLCGYNEESIRTFLPRDKKRAVLNELLMKSEMVQIA